MYLEYLETVATYVKALNEACESIDEDKRPGLMPYVNNVPVYLDGEVQGYLVDEIGGEYSYITKDEFEAKGVQGR